MELLLIVPDGWEVISLLYTCRREDQAGSYLFNHATLDEEREGLLGKVCGVW